MPVRVISVTPTVASRAVLLSNCSSSPNSEGNTFCIACGIIIRLNVDRSGYPNTKHESHCPRGIVLIPERIISVTYPLEQNANAQFADTNPEILIPNNDGITK